LISLAPRFSEVYQIHQELAKPFQRLLSQTIETVLRDVLDSLPILLKQGVNERAP
jgi:hypothetical protein